MKLLRKHTRKIAALLLLLSLTDIATTSTAWALTGGPSQPEVQSFEPVNTTQMVEVSTGDFTYNMPLLDVGGYPVNISYHSGITMDQEASWVGLGWNINPGVINRQMRGLPDDFNGDPIEKEYNIRTNFTVGLDLGVGVSFVELPMSLGANAGIFYNNYKGVGFKAGTSFSFSVACSSNQKDVNTSGLGVNLSLGIQFDSQNGIGVMPNVGLSLSSTEQSETSKVTTSVGLNVGASYNSRGGLSALSYGLSVSSSTTRSEKKKDADTNKPEESDYQTVGSSSGSISRSSSISFASQAVTPTVNFPMQNFGFTAKIMLGGFTPIYGGEVNISGDITGYYSHQKLVKKQETLGAYGYMYMHEANTAPKALLDFNREKDQPFRKPSKKKNDEGAPVMALPSYQYDLLGVNGQGIGGQYRSMRSDIGFVYDHEVSSWSGSGNVAMDIAFGTYASIGLDLNANVSNTTTSYWKGGNELFDDLRFYGNDNTLFEPAAFINIGEKTINDQNYYNAIGDIDPIRVDIGGWPFQRTARKHFTKYRSGQNKGGAAFNTFKNPTRTKRNQVMSYVTAGEADIQLQSGTESITLDKKIKDYKENEYNVDLCGNALSYTTVDRIDQSNSRRSHLTEVTVLAADGKRYVYGIPAYNRKQRDVTFNVNHTLGNESTGMVSYNGGVDNTSNNKLGLDHFFSAETMPDFAHSYLLTAILSPDYVDLTGNGISDDDIGDGVQINYSRIYGTAEAKGTYKWRMPYAKNGSVANYQPGFHTDEKDDKGNYSYGEKEVWYMHSIVSKTMVALFHLSDREDGLGVNDENGGRNTNATLKKLDKIDLFSKSDLFASGANAVPIKTVHFEYSYRLCGHVENNSEHAVDVNGGDPTVTGLPNVNTNKGKLTLERMYFTYQRNTTGRLNPYVFHYDNDNPNYDFKKYDRWGNYKDNTLVSPPLAANEVDFPYTIQNTKTNDFAKAWSMSSVDLPTGGTINIDYEADDYAYVQDKRAQQMVQLEGVGNTDNYNNKTDVLYAGNLPNAFNQSDHNRYMFFTAQNPVLTKDDVYKQYIDGIEKEYVFYRCAVKMYSDHPDSKAEYVPGYAKIEDWGACPDHTHFWIKLKGEPVANSGSEIANPIFKSALQLMRMSLAKLAYPGSENDPTDFVSVIKSLVAPIFDLQNMFMGFTPSAMSKLWCRKVVLNRSWLRLNNPVYKKYGGGARVKSVTISDNWAGMVSNTEPSAVYGQVYDYTKPLYEGGPLISSGVAEWEPANGGDEICFRLPLQFKERTKLAPHNQFYIEKPIGETFFPAANVVYSQVKVQSYGSSNLPQNQGTGYTLHTYYTAKDFPLSTDYTPLDPHPDMTPSIFQIFSLPKIEHFTGSQGFQVEMNDMHGKPRSQEVYNNAGEVVSKTIYNYVVDNPTAPKLHLKNEVTVLMPDGTIQYDKPVGKSIELMTDFRHQATNQGSGGALITIDISSIVPPPIPLPIPTVFPTISYENTQFRSVSTTKIVRRFGILESTTAQQYGSTVTTRNMVYDSETGEVLLTRTKNEFEDDIYNYTVPAHLVYDGMGPAYKNVGAVFNNVWFNNGHINPPALESNFTEGDEVLAYRNINHTGEKLWVINPHHTDASQAVQNIFVDRNGNPYTETHPHIAKIIRSGRRNQATTPIASVVSMKTPIHFSNPADPTHSSFLDPVVADDIVNTSATEFKDNWKIRCDKVTTLECDHCNRPSCDCMYNLIKTIADNNWWDKRPEDSIFINSCCLDSCFYDNGTYSNANCYGCKRHFYSLKSSPLPGGYTMADGYEAMVGRCRLKVYFYTPPGSVYRFNQPVNKLTVPPPADITFNDTTCTNICNEYETTGKYPLRGQRMGAFSRSFYAELICDPVCKPVCVDLNDGQQINPYKFGLLGNWRPEKQWVYRDMRTPGNINTAGTTNIRTDGVFNDYKHFWVYDNSAGRFVRDPNLQSKYIDATTITKYNFKGAEIENRDAAGIYSAALFGYLETQAVAVAKNARYKNIAFDGFEDYVFKTDCNLPCRVDHFNFRENLDNGCLSHCAEIDETEAHTGNRSVRVLSTGAGLVSMVRDLKVDTDNPELSIDNTTGTYKLTQHGCLPKFSPDAGKYFVSAWAKEVPNCNTLQYTNAKIRITYTGSSQVDELTPTGNVIEGWQRIEGVIDVPASATQIKVELLAGTGVSVNYDDIRIQPFNSSMKTYVYDDRSMKLYAELDENNFATFYEYSDDGTLIRIKKETERGIMTIQESRSTLKKY